MDFVFPNSNARGSLKVHPLHGNEGESENPFVEEELVVISSKENVSKEQTPAQAAFLSASKDRMYIFKPSMWTLMHFYGKMVGIL
jgi:prephenate dehydrogenase